MAASPVKATEQVLIRVSPEIYTALQLALPFARKRSMQDLMSMIIEGFLADLRGGDPGFERALVGLRESEARRTGVLARRTTSAEDAS